MSPNNSFKPTLLSQCGLIQALALNGEFTVNEQKVQQHVPHQQPRHLEPQQPQLPQQQPQPQQSQSSQPPKKSPALGLAFIIAGVALAAYSGYLVDSKPAIALAVFGASIVALTRAVDVIKPRKKLLYTLTLDVLGIFIAYLAAAYLA